MLRRPGRPRAGFTLVELLVVIVIVGILLAFILSVSLAGARNAQIQGTRELLVKLDMAVADRLDALMAQRANVNGAHRFLGSINTGITSGSPFLQSQPRAQVIAQVDYLRAEMPEVFFFDPNNADYPINFGAMPYDPLTSVSSLNGSPYSPYILPIGSAITPMFAPVAYGQAGGTMGAGNWNGANNMPMGTGIFGASYAARGGLAKALGAQPTGYDGADNDGNGLTDEVGEWGVALTSVQGKLRTHTHKTARAEALYALLTEGIGPLGSAFSPDDFTNREVRDTDGDGLLEFVDAWGEPLQFYLWPTAYRSDTQRGAINPQGFDGIDNDGDGTVDNVDEASVYYGFTDQREQNPLDPSQLLVAPAWWAQSSGMATTFQSLFFTLTEDPYLSGLNSSAATAARLWNRSSTPAASSLRRAYNAKFLIVSSGPDKGLGLYQLDDATIQTNVATPQNIAKLLIGDSSNNMRGENMGFPMTPSTFSGSPLAPVPQDADDNLGDDISNQTVQAPGGYR